MDGRKAQSAMEYLMTYGWSILVLAVVVSALFTLGAFHSAPLVNACLAASGYSCSLSSLSSLGTLSATVGEIGQNINIIATGCTTTPTLSTQVNQLNNTLAQSLSSSQKAPLIFNCPIPSGSALGTQFNGFIWIEYNVNNGPQGVKIRIAEVKAVVSSIGSASSSNALGLNFKITNTNTVAATAAPFQQMVSFNPSNSVYSSNEASNLGNLRFYEGGAELNSWCESGCSSSSSNAVFWINIPGGIGANSNVVIVANTLPTSTQYDGIYAGECPSCSVTGYTSLGIPISYSIDPGRQTSPGISIDTFAGDPGNGNLWLCGVGEPDGAGYDDIGSSFSIDVEDSGTASAIGNQGSDDCYAEDDGGWAGVAIGINTNGISYGSPQTEYWDDADPIGGPYPSPSFSTSSTSFVVLIVACGGADGDINSYGENQCTTTLSPPLDGYCSDETGSVTNDGEESAQLWVCQALPAGTWTLNPTSPSGSSSGSFAAYVFPNVTEVPAGYATYDNGANVFPLMYQNFKGTSCPSSWTCSGSYTISNSLSIGAGGTAWTTSRSYGLNSGSVLDFGGQITNANGYSYSGFVDVGGTSNYRVAWNAGNDGSDISFHAYDGSDCSADTYSPPLNGIYSIYWPTTSAAYGWYNYAPAGTISSCLPNSAASIGMHSESGGTMGPIWWFRLRTYPPGGVMPSVTQGSFT